MLGTLGDETALLRFEGAASRPQLGIILASLQHEAANSVELGAVNGSAKPPTELGRAGDAAQLRGAVASHRRTLLKGQPRPLQQGE
jgi:hypothetical protein